MAVVDVVDVVDVAAAVFLVGGGDFIAEDVEDDFGCRCVTVAVAVVGVVAVVAAVVVAAVAVLFVVCVTLLGGVLFTLLSRLA